jgi:hypothetical protein
MKSGYMISRIFSFLSGPKTLGLPPQTPPSARALDRVSAPLRVAVVVILGFDD